MPKNFFQDIADKLQATLPSGVKNIQEEVERLVKESIDSTLANFKLVRYDDFEIQQKVLLKTREKLEKLTQRVEILESLLTAELSKNGDLVVIDESLSVVQAEESVTMDESTEIELITSEEGVISTDNIDHETTDKSFKDEEGKDNSRTHQ